MGSDARRADNRQDALNAERVQQQQRSPALCCHSNCPITPPCQCDGRHQGHTTCHCTWLRTRKCVKLYSTVSRLPSCPRAARYCRQCGNRPFSRHKVHTVMYCIQWESGRSTGLKISTRSRVSDVHQHSQPISTTEYQLRFGIAPSCVRFVMGRRLHRLTSVATSAAWDVENMHAVAT